MTQEQKQSVFAYLTRLRESGKINMFLAPSVIAQVFELNHDTSLELFWEWTETLRSNEDTEDED